MAALRYYKIKLLVTYEQETAIVDLFAARGWLFSKLDNTGSPNDWSSHDQTDSFIQKNNLKTDEIAQCLQNSAADSNLDERHTTEREIESLKDITITGDDVSKIEEGQANKRVLSDDNNSLDIVKVETKLCYPSNSEQESEDEDIPDQNENVLNTVPVHGEVEEEEYSKQIILGNTNLENPNKIKQKLAAKLRDRKIKCQSPQINGNKFKTGTRQRRRGNTKKNSQLKGKSSCSFSSTDDKQYDLEYVSLSSIKESNASKFKMAMRQRKKGNKKKNTQPKEESSIASTNDKQSDQEETSLSDIKDDGSTLKTVKSRKNKPNWSYFKKESVHCDICQYTFKMRGNYERHLTDDRCRHDCKFCGKVFLGGQSYRYKNHLMTHEKKGGFENSGPDHTTKCEIGVADQRKIKQPMTRMRGDRKYDCSKCTKVLTSSSGLAYHIKRCHKPGRLWPCTICGKDFTERYILTKHQTTHRTEKNFKCDECPATFARKLYLSEHKRRHAKDYSHICSDCGAGFYAKKELRNHQAKHTGEKSYCCSVCGLMFSYLPSLRTHMKKHSGMRKYACKECDAAFFYCTSLKRHMSKHSGVKEFECKECNAAFIYDSSLHRHMKKHEIDMQ